MAKRIAKTSLNASTLDILNTIRANASYEYQNLVPAVTKATDIPKVGEVIYGTPALANQFINALVNRIAIVRANSAVFNNPYADLKKGYLEFGETIEDIFVNIAKVIDYSAEKAEAREFKRTLPDVRSAFHAMNWRVIYPITIQDEDLKLAFLSMDGVQDLIAKIVDSVYTAAEYDEYLLFKYLMIKAIANGKMYPVSIGAGTAATMNEAAVAFRGTSNILPFMSSKYNEYGVKTTTPKERQVIFMDAQFNAQFDVNVLASAFNMDKADFIGRLKLIDDWTSFDNERFDVIRANSDGIEEVTAAELALLADVKAVILDTEWFQIYDNNNKMTEKYVASGLRWNYFYHVWKTVSSSPFANAVAFVTSNATITLPDTLTYTVDSVIRSGDVLMVTLKQNDTNALKPSALEFVQNQSATDAGVAVNTYGAIAYPISGTETEAIPSVVLTGKIGDTGYTAGAALDIDVSVGDTVTMTKNA